MAVVEGDILLPLPGAGPAPVYGLSRDRTLRRWPGGIVPYEPYTDMPDYETRITPALAHWEAVSRVEFVPWVQALHGEARLKFVADSNPSECECYAGRLGAQQTVKLGAYCDEGAVIHELGHALGLWHEHTRPDRDDHVMIHWDNIIDGKETQFEYFYLHEAIGEEGRSQGPYDLQSIMHYDSYADSANGLPTITLTDGVTTFVSNREYATTGDICAVHKFNQLIPPSDIDGDGYSDLVVGVINEGFGTTGNDHGAIQVIFGSASGVSDRDQLLQRESTGVAGTGHEGDGFGAAIAVGDFNADCYFDIAVGVPYETISGLVEAGSIHVFYGASFGVRVDNDVTFSASTIGVGAVGSFDHFGHALTAGDFNGDGYSDLAIGSPGDDTNAGSVTVILGSGSGLITAGAQLWRQGPTLADSPEAGDAFGQALLGVDTNHDGFDELVVGAPGESVGNAAGAGAVHVILGSIDGLTSTSDQFWTSSNTGVGLSSAGNAFGFSFAAGYFNADDSLDLAIGEPYDDVAGTILQTGAVIVLQGGDFGLTTTGAQRWHQNVGLVYGTAEAGDYYGAAVAAGDFDADGYDDLAVGVPGDTILGNAQAGAISVLHGSYSGLTDARSNGWYQDLGSMESASEAGDFFGLKLKALDFDSDNHSDLAIGVPMEDDTRSNVGAVHLMYGAQGVGLDDDRNDLLTQDSPGILSGSAVNEYFGFAL